MGPHYIAALGSDKKVVVLHFSADSKEVTRDAFEAAIGRLITSSSPRPLSEAGKEGESKEAITYSIPSESILYYATFELSAENVAANTCGGAAYRKHITTPQLLAFSEELAAADVGDVAPQTTETSPISAPKAPVFYSSSLLTPSTASPFSDEAFSTNANDASRSKEIASLQASPVCSLLNDGSYVCEAIALYNSIMAHLLTFGKDDWATCDQSEYRKRDEEKSVAQPSAAGTSQIPLATPAAEQKWMPFLYKLPDPSTGRDDDEDPDRETHATYAKQLLTAAAPEAAPDLATSTASALDVADN
eukprot:GDKK01053486.1.p1 GENE.GDKK01053486.1~~GDKK01053486.1.p1  ORF type:complete len:304 (-),score=21.45 GDKK01053486.1:54-965(-)